MKKIILAVMIIFLSACTLGMNATPKQKVSEFLDKYKNQDTSVITQLDEVVNNEYTNEQYRSRYKNLMLNQYKNMKYKITDEVIEGDNAVVEAQITVYDYASSIRNANEYLNANPDIFNMEDKTTLDEDDADDETTKDTSSNANNSLMNNYDEDKFLDYKLTQMENVSDTVTYTMEFTLTKQNGKWKMDSLSTSDMEKLHGIYLSQD